MAANIFEKLSEMFSSLKADDGDDEEEEEEEVLFDAQHALGHHFNSHEIKRNDKPDRPWSFILSGGPGGSRHRDQREMCRDRLHKVQGETG